MPADFDTVSTITLALCHLTLAPLSVAGLMALRAAVRARLDVAPGVGTLLATGGSSPVG